MLNNILYSTFEQNIIISIQNSIMFLAPFFKQVGLLCGSDMFMIIILILYLIYDKKLAKIIAMSYTLSSALTGFIKNLVARQRPFQVNSQIQCVQSPGEHMNIFSDHHKAPPKALHNTHHHSYSFPSGHSSSGASFYGSIANYVRNKYITIICAVLIVLIGFSRIFLGVHFPSDVIAGIILGLLCVFFVSYLFEKFDSYTPYIIIFVILLLIEIVFHSTQNLSSIATFLGFALAFIFEEKFVDFEITHDTVPAVSRIVCGVILYFILEYLSINTFNSGSLRIVSGFLTNFILFGIYPWVFSRISIFSGSDN